MFWALFWFSIGLVVGWNFLPQPEVVKSLVDKGVELVSSVFKKTEQK